MQDFMNLRISVSLPFMMVSSIIWSDQLSHKTNDVMTLPLAVGCCCAHASLFSNIL